MIAGIFHQGSGLGDQLFRYITVRTLAEEKGYDFCMWWDEYFKGKEFMNLEMGPYFPDPATVTKWKEKEVRENGIDIRSYDPEINFIKDHTLLDGSFEDDKYWGHNLEKINKWLAVEPLEIPDWKLLIGFRGGEYSSNSDLFLPKEYYKEALSYFKDEQKNVQQVHTDDSIMAKSFFDFIDNGEIIANSPISHSKHITMGFNWRSMRYSKNAIIPNSAFFILPRLLKHFEDPTAVTIAPRYWARHNTKVWARPACYYKQFTYI